MYDDKSMEDHKILADPQSTEMTSRLRQARRRIARPFTSGIKCFQNGTEPLCCSLLELPSGDSTVSSSCICLRQSRCANQIPRGACRLASHEVSGADIRNCSAYIARRPVRSMA